MGIGIGEAVNRMRDGGAVRRAGWNGMWLFLNAKPATAEGPDGIHRLVQPHVLMRAADATVVPWLCSQTDLLATDWEVVPSAERTA